MQTNNLVRKTKNKKSKLIGRGGKRGKTSGRGTKGQWAHGSHGVRPELRDTIKKFPKLRGHGKNRSASVDGSKIRPTVINLDILEENFKDGELINVDALMGKNLIKKVGGKTPKVKILGRGVVKKKFKILGLEISATAKASVEKAGGSVK
jgi:large subunit ribosomal protein L15